MYALLRPLLFCLPPEVAHRVALQWLPYAQSVGYADYSKHTPSQHTTINFCGLTLKNRIALAAGFDKNALHLPSLAKLGFACIEVGTITPLAQDGNPQPRLFRIPQAQALLNRMGFNNDGMVAILERIKAAQAFCHTQHCYIGCNLGKNASTPLEQASTDYVKGLTASYDYADYFVINISSPNTTNLRKLQTPASLQQLLAELHTTRRTKINSGSPHKPLLIKLAPDISDDDIYAVLDTIMTAGMDGIIATNTTIDHSAINQWQYGSGGLSGAPLRDKAQTMLVKIRRHLGKNFPIMASGGILSADDASARVQAGADVVQLYTGLIYRGPGLVKACIQKLQNASAAAAPSQSFTANV